MTDANWRSRAACRGTDPEQWLATHPRKAARALAVCQGCPVRQPCLSYALAHPDVVGIWGGTTRQERHRTPTG